MSTLVDIDSPSHGMNSTINCGYHYMQGLRRYEESATLDYRLHQQCPTRNLPIYSNLMFHNSGLILHVVVILDFVNLLLDSCDSLVG